MVGAVIMSAACLLAATAGQNVCDPSPAGAIVSSLWGELNFAGDSVAVSGETAVVGVPMYQPPGGPASAGGAFAYRLEGGVWVEEGFLGVPTARSGDRAGFAVAIDGDAAVVSSPYRSGFSGEVFVYRRRATAEGPRWEVEANIKPPEDGSLFGHDVSIDGDVLAIGQPYADGSAEGCVQVYVRTGGQWRHAARVRASGASAFDLIGTSVALRGRWLVAGAPLETRFPSFGSAYVFERTDVGWVQRGRLIPDGAVFEDQAGHDVAVDEPYLAIASTQAYGLYGRVWIYRYDGAEWMQERTLAPPESPRTSAIRQFGSGIALRGNRLAVGAPWWDRDGGVFGYERTDQGWILSSVVGHADLSGEGLEVIDLGRTVALDGDLAVSGAPFTRFGKLFTGGAMAVRFPARAFGLIEQPADQPLVSAGDGASFGVSASGPGMLDYQWMLEGVPLVDDDRISGSRTPRLVIAGSEAADSGEYRCMVSSSECGERVSGPAYLYFGDCVRIEESPAAVTIEAGSAAMFTASASGLAPVAYQWYRSGSPLRDDERISGSATPKLTLASTLPEDAGAYSCVATSRCGAASSGRATLEFVPCAEVVREPESASVYERDLGTLSIVAAGTLPLTYQWTRDGAPLSDDGRVRGTATPTLVIHPLSRDDSGVYACVVSCGYTAEVSLGATITVNIRPCFGDANHDRGVDLVDVTAVLSNYGRVYDAGGGQGDADLNRVVDFMDIASVLANFGDACAS
jgi:hypothetical protein